MFRFLTSLFGTAQSKTETLILTDENHNQYYQKGVTLIEPYAILSDQLSRLNKKGKTKLLEGIRYFDAVTQINPDNFGAFWFKGKAYQALNEHENAYISSKNHLSLTSKIPM